MTAAPTKSDTYGVLAEFDTAHGIYIAAEKVREAGYTRWDALTPFPVHGLERVMGLEASRVPIVALVMALCGACLGLALEYWTSAVDYPLVIAGKPFFSWPAFVPVIFELTVLFGAAGALLSSLFFARLPRWYHPSFYGQASGRVSDDRFCLLILAADPRFDAAKTVEFCQQLSPRSVELIQEP